MAQLTSLDCYSLPAHPFADGFPMDENGLPDLAENLKVCGQRLPIIIMDGMVLDGRRRLKAAEIAGLIPVTRPYDPQRDGNPLDLVVSLNVQRRHEQNADWTKIATDYLINFTHFSDRRIADATRMSRTKVAKLRQQLEDAGTIRAVTERVGRNNSVRDATPSANGVHKPPPATTSGPTADGKNDVAAQESPPEKTTPTLDTAADPEDEAGGGATAAPHPADSRQGDDAGPPAAAKDALDAAIPDHLRDVFADDIVATYHEALESLERRIKGDSKLYWRHHANGTVFNLIHSLAQCLTRHAPHSVCRKCGGTGDGCGTCKTTGWVSNAEYLETVRFEQGGGADEHDDPRDATDGD